MERYKAGLISGGSKNGGKKAVVETELKSKQREPDFYLNHIIQSYIFITLSSYWNFYKYVETLLSLESL